jgi:hypothetical protein
MRQAMRYGRQPMRQGNQRQVSVGTFVPAPVGGWDAQNPLSNMPAQNAVTLDNFIPRNGYVEFRKGFRPWQTGLNLPVETVMVWRSNQSVLDKIFGASGANIWDMSSDGGTPVSAYSTAASPRWQWINFANDAGVFLIAANGAQAPVYYNGTSFADSVISGSAGVITLDPATLTDVMDHKGRLFFTQKDSMRIWYLDPLAIQGTANLLDLGPIFDKGGSILCQATWTVDGGAGADDLAVWVTTQGQIAVYQGTDPSNADDWALVGIYDVGFPLSRRSLIKYGSDLVVVTSDGVIPLSQALRLDRAQENLVALTQKIQNAFQQSTQRYRQNFGWEGVLYPKASLAIFNVPITELATSEQYVQNVQTGAWCRFTGINAYSWAIANDDPYFGGADGIYIWDTGYADNENTITADMLTAYNYFGRPGAKKKFKMLQPVLRIGVGIAPAVEVVTDFVDRVPTNVPTTVETEGARWDVALWNVGLWSPNTQTTQTWTTVTGIGYCGAVRLRVAIEPLLYTDLAVGDDEDSLVSSDGTDIIAVNALRNTNAPVEIVAFNLKYENGVGGQI